VYQYVLSVVLGIYMSQFIYQMHGMFEMYFLAFIGSALLITYQYWKLQLPMLLFVVLHHTLLSHLQTIGLRRVYFNQLNYTDVQTVIIHIFLTVGIFLICGLCAFQLHKYNEMELLQGEQLRLLQEGANNSTLGTKDAQSMKERNTILESIGASP
jgi:two-component system sensor histidine kinase/response regulator